MKRFAAIAMVATLFFPTQTAYAIEDPAPLVISFAGTSVKLNSSQKADISLWVLTQENVWVANNSLGTFKCDGLYLKNDSMTKKVIAKKRAKAVCDYINGMARGYFYWGDGKVTSKRSDSGKVSLRVEFWD